MLSLLLAASVALQPPAPGSGEHKAKPETISANPKREAQTDKELPPPLKIDSSASQGNAEDRNDHTSKEAAKDWGFNPDSVIAVATVFLTVFTFGLGAFTLMLVCETRKAVEDSREALRLTREEFEATHRPRLLIRQIRLVLDEPARIDFLIFNVGEGIASLTDSHLEVVTLGLGDKLSPPGERMGTMTTLRALAPGQLAGYSLLFKGPAIEHLQMLKGTAYERMSGTSPYLAFRGFVIYTDASGKIGRRMSWARSYDHARDRFAPMDEPDYEYSD